MQRESMSKYDSYVSHQLLTPEQEREYGLMAVAGNEDGIEKLIVNNLRLVIFMAEHYYKSGAKLNYDDIVSAGVEGLMEAARRYDPNRGSKFSSYAMWWIKQRIKKAMMEEIGPMRVPLSIARKRLKVDAFINSHRGMNGAMPDLDMLKENFPDMPRQMLKSFLQIHDTVYLDSTISGETEGNVSEIVADESAEKCDEHILHQETAGEIERMLENLKPREQIILTLRFGIDRGKGRTLEEVSRIISRTRERVRQIERSALEKLRKIARFEMNKKF